MCALGGHAVRLGARRGVPAFTAHLHAIGSSLLATRRTPVATAPGLAALRRACGLSTWQRTGRHVRSLEAFALPAYKIARKSEEEMAGVGGEPSNSPSGPRFPFKDEFEIGKGLVLSGQQVVDTLAPLMTPERIQRIDEVVAARTFNVLPIVEHTYDLGNLAAVCRSADALGFGGVHVVRNMADQRYKQSARSSAGADKWLDVKVWDSTQECLLNAKRQGYQVVVTHLSPDAVDISQVDWTRPTAFVLGNEEKGVTPDAVALADACAVVPMAGFVDSFNISVAAALIMYEARRQRVAALGSPGDLSAEERAVLRALFFLRSKGQSREYIQHMLSRPPPAWQAHRGGGDWGGKRFLHTAAGAAEAGSGGGGWAAGELPVQRVQTTACHYWDGRCCWGERLLWPGKRCRYHLAHNHGTSTFNKEKLRQMCGKLGLPFPDLAAPPPPLPPELQQREEAAAAAAAAAAEQRPEAVEARRAREALLAAAAPGTAGGATAAAVETAQ